jgi:uncharacterized RDD family membrane protein YckC
LPELTPSPLLPRDPTGSYPPPPSPPWGASATPEGFVEATSSDLERRAGEDPTGIRPSEIVVASGLRQGLAGLIDAIVLLAASGGASFGLLRARGVTVDVQPIIDFAFAEREVAALVLIGAPLAIVAAYQLVGVAALQGTLGQRLVGVRVVRIATGGRPGFLRATVRAVFCALGVAALGAGPLYGVFVDRWRRGWGDLVARTVAASSRPRAS